MVSAYFMFISLVIVCLMCFIEEFDDNCYNFFIEILKEIQNKSNNLDIQANYKPYNKDFGVFDRKIKFCLSCKMEALFLLIIIL